MALVLQHYEQVILKMQGKGEVFGSSISSVSVFLIKAYVFKTFVFQIK